MYPSAQNYFDRVSKNFIQLSRLAPVIDQAAAAMTQALRGGCKMIFCGNGGSAADSQHLAAELVGRYMKDRAALAAIALTVDTSALTAIANDYGYTDVFSRQLRALGQSGDVLIGLSTSGNSENVLRAMSAARELAIATIGLTGQEGGKLRTACDIAICVPASEPNHIQEMHIAVGHYLCGYVESALYRGKKAPAGRRKLSRSRRTIKSR
jgi:D-sedoheptulose 7-phosphate isomerase